MCTLCTVDIFQFYKRRCENGAEHTEKMLRWDTKQMWWRTKTTQGHCGGEVGAAAHLAACRRPLQRWNNPRHLSQKFVQTTCSEHKRVEKKSFPAVSVQDRKRGHKRETSLTLDRGRSAGGRRRRQTFSKKAKFIPNAGYDLKSNASKFFLYN